jgi:putrescine aminotransferase
MNKQDAALFSDYAKLVSQGTVDRMKALGHDFIPTSVEGPYVFHGKKRHLDATCAAGIYNLGRRPPELAEALRSAMYVADQGNFPMISREKSALAEKLAQFTPGDLECAIYSVVRGETVEFACKLARGFTGRKELLAPPGSWFGETGFALSLSERADKEVYAPLIPETRVAPLDDLSTITDRTAAVLIEPVQAENGCRVFDDEFLRTLQARCRQTGTLLIFDETQTGFGRTGKKFACETSGVIPDALIVGEALGGGMFPIAATIITQKLNRFMNDHPMIHLSTFGGSDLGCAVALRAMELYESKAPWSNAEKLGTLLLERLAKVGGPVKSVRGSGLLLALETTNEKTAIAFCKGLAKQGVLAWPGEVDKQSVLLRPALTITEQDADSLIEAVEKTAAALSK